MNNILEVRELCTYFKNTDPKTKVIDNINLEIKKGEIIGLVGESGCGKTMLAMSIMSLLPDNAVILNGAIKLDGKDILKLNNKELLNLRGSEMSMIFQDPMTCLNPLMTIGRQLSEVLLKHKKINKKAAKNESIKMLEKVGIIDAEKRYNSYPHQLSGGIRQRVMIAMALICKPKLLIADEPTTALDVTIQAQVLILIKKLCKEIGTSVIFISHNMGVIASICDYVYVMYAGKVVEESSVFDLFEESKHPYTKALLDSIPDLNKNVKRLNTIEGKVPNLKNLGDFCSFYNRCKCAKKICMEKAPDLYNIENINKHKVRCFLYIDNL